jgi:transposase
MKTTRKRYSSDFKAKVSLEAIRGEMTLSELGAKHGIHPKVIGGWKKQAMEGLAGVFDASEPAAKTVSEAEVEKLHAKIGQLLVERDFLAKASGR